MRRLGGAAIIGALGLMVVAGCGGGASPSPITTPPPVPSPSVSAPSPTAGPSAAAQAFPTGRWQAGFPGQGVAVFDFRSDGTWTLTTGASLDGQRPFSSGTYAIDGNTLAWLTDTGCPKGVERGTYTWTATPLAFTKVSDECAARIEGLSHAWTPVE